MYTKTLLVDTLAVSYKKNDSSSILYIARSSQTSSCFISFWCRYLQYKSFFFFSNIYHSLKNVNKFHTHIKIHTFQDI